MFDLIIDQGDAHWPVIEYIYTFTVYCVTFKILFLLYYKLQTGNLFTFDGMTVSNLPRTKLDPAFRDS